MSGQGICGATAPGFLGGSEFRCHLDYGHPSPVHEDPSTGPVPTRWTDSAEGARTAPPRATPGEPWPGDWPPATVTVARPGDLVVVVFAQTMEQDVLESITDSLHERRPAGVEFVVMAGVSVVVAQGRAER